MPDSTDDRDDQQETTHNGIHPFVAGAGRDHDGTTGGTDTPFTPCRPHPGENHHDPHRRTQSDDVELPEVATSDTSPRDRLGAVLLPVAVAVAALQTPLTVTVLALVLVVPGGVAFQRVLEG